LFLKCKEYIPLASLFCPASFRGSFNSTPWLPGGEIESKGEDVKKGLVDVQLGLREKIIIIIIIMFLSNLLFYLKSHPTIVLKF